VLARVLKRTQELCGPRGYWPEHGYVAAVVSLFGMDIGEYHHMLWPMTHSLDPLTTDTVQRSGPNLLTTDCHVR
jgi:hypothetical protein